MDARVSIASFGFLFANLLVISIIVFLKRKTGKPSSSSRPSLQPALESDRIPIDPKDVLEWEYEYVRHTASEAMQDRHTMINFYLVLVGVVASGVIANLKELEKWQGAAIILLWSVCAIGWFHFLILVRLREAWHDSVRTMLEIRDFCINHTCNVEPRILMKAFRWRQETLPEAARPWSVFFYSALLIGFLDSMVFAMGCHLLSVDRHTVSPVSTLLLVILALGLFCFHIWVYFAMLKSRTANLEPQKP